MISSNPILFQCFFLGLLLFTLTSSTAVSQHIDVDAQSHPDQSRSISDLISDSSIHSQHEDESLMNPTDDEDDDRSTFWPSTVDKRYLTKMARAGYSPMSNADGRLWAIPYRFGRRAAMPYRFGKRAAMPYRFGKRAAAAMHFRLGKRSASS